MRGLWRRLFLGLLLCLVSSWSLAAQPTLKSLEAEPIDIKPPNWGRPAQTFTIDNYTLSGAPALSAKAAAVTKRVLENGLVYLSAEEPTQELVSFDYLVRCGVGQEGSNQQGYNALILQILNNRISNDSHNDDVVEITGSLVDVGTSPDFCRININTAPINSLLMLRRLCQAVARPQFSAAEVELARRQVLNALTSASNDQLYSIFLSCFYRLHPYKRTPHPVEVIIKRVTPQELSAYYQRNFAPNRSVLTSAGKISGREAFKIVSATCAGLVPNKEQVLEVQWEPQAVEREVYLYSSSELAWVLLGYQAPSLQSSDFAAMRVIYGALGAGLSSRLWTELRENRGLAYEVGARYPELLGPSHLLCHVVTKPTSVGVARRRMLAEIDRLKREGMTPLELQEVREKLLGTYLLERETMSGKALHLGMAELSGAGYEADARFPAELARVTPQDVVRVANKYLIEPTLIIARPGGRFYFDW